MQSGINVLVKQICYICTQKVIYQRFILIYATIVWKMLDYKDSQTYMGMIRHQQAGVGVIKYVTVSLYETLVV